MPIKGVTERTRFPRIGKVRLGMKKENEKGREYPTGLDFFHVNDLDGMTDKEAAAHFRRIYGEEPSELKILFPFDDPEECFPHFYKAYKTGGLWCWGDGEEGHRRTESGDWSDVSCPCPFLNDDKNTCRMVGTLKFFLPDVPGLGVWHLETSSYNSIVNINSGLKLLLSVTRGFLSSIPVKLRLVPMDVQPKGMKYKKTVHVLELVQMDLTVGQIREMASEDVGLAGALPAPVTENLSLGEGEVLSEEEEAEEFEDFLDDHYKDVTGTNPPVIPIVERNRNIFSAMVEEWKGKGLSEETVYKIAQECAKPHKRVEDLPDFEWFVKEFEAKLNEELKSFGPPEVEE